MIFPFDLCTHIFVHIPYIHTHIYILSLLFLKLTQGDDPSVGNVNFWDELFLLKVNAVFLDRCISSLSEEQLMSLKVREKMIMCWWLVDNETVVIHRHTL